MAEGASVEMTVRSREPGTSFVWARRLAVDFERDAMPDRGIHHRLTNAWLPLRRPRRMPESKPDGAQQAVCHLRPVWLKPDGPTR
jgi:hypothetical protein